MYDLYKNLVHPGGWVVGSYKGLSRKLERKLERRRVRVDYMGN